MQTRSSTENQTVVSQQKAQRYAAMKETLRVKV